MAEIPLAIGILHVEFSVYLYQPQVQGSPVSSASEFDIPIIAELCEKLQLHCRRERSSIHVSIDTAIGYDDPSQSTPESANNNAEVGHPIALGSCNIIY